MLAQIDFTKATMENKYKRVIKFLNDNPQATQQQKEKFVSRLFMLDIGDSASKIIKKAERIMKDV